MEKHTVSADTAALVAAQLTQARMTITAGVFAGRKAGGGVTIAPYAVEKTYLHFLEFIRNGAAIPAEDAE